MVTLGLRQALCSGVWLMISPTQIHPSCGPLWCYHSSPIYLGSHAQKLGSSSPQILATSCPLHSVWALEHGRGRPCNEVSRNLLSLVLKILSELSVLFSSNTETKGLFLPQPLVCVPSVTPLQPFSPLDSLLPTSGTGVSQDSASWGSGGGWAGAMPCCSMSHLREHVTQPEPQFPHL